MTEVSELRRLLAVSESQKADLLAACEAALHKIENCDRILLDAEWNTVIDGLTAAIASARGENPAPTEPKKTNRI